MPKSKKKTFSQGMLFEDDNQNKKFLVRLSDLYFLVLRKFGSDNNVEKIVCYAIWI